MRENRFSPLTASSVPARSRLHNGSRAPAQKVMLAACTNTAGRVSHCGSAEAAWPVSAKVNPAPASASSAAILPGPPFRISDSIASSMAAAPMAAEGPRLVENPVVQGLALHSEFSGDPRASRPWSPTESGTATRPAASARGAAGPWSRTSGVTHLRKNTLPTPKKIPT